MALLYSQYAIEFSSFRFVSAAPTTFSGRITMAWNFDTSDPKPTTTHQMWQQTGAVSTSPWRGITTTLPRNSGDKRRFPVLGSAAWIALSPADRQIYTPATLNFALDNTVQNGNLFGSLIWSYRIRFFNANILAQPENPVTILTLLADAEDEAATSPVVI